MFYLHVCNFYINSINQSIGTQRFSCCVVFAVKRNNRGIDILVIVYREHNWLQTYPGKQLFKDVLMLLHIVAPLSMVIIRPFAIHT